MKPLPPPSTSTSSAVIPLPLPKPSTTTPTRTTTTTGEVERQVRALTAPRIKPTTTAGGKSLRRPPTGATSATAKPSLSNKYLQSTSSPGKIPQGSATPSKPAQQSPSK